jgi:hypothetical protein
MPYGRKHGLKHEKPFKCQEPRCKQTGQAFSTSDEFDRHQKSVHHIYPSTKEVSFLELPQTMAKVATPGSEAHAKATPTSIPMPAPKERQPILPADQEKEEEQQIPMPMSLLDYAYEDTFADRSMNTYL